jgi:hypothetical protein
VADYYSRHPCGLPGVTAFLEELRTEQFVNAVAMSAVPDAISIEQVVEATLADSEMQHLSRVIAERCDGYKLPTAMAPYKRVFDELSVSTDGIVMRGDRIVIPASMREQVVALAHSGHQGIVKTKSYIRSRVWFPGIDQLVERRVQQCHHCQAAGQRTAYEPLCPSPMPHGAWQEVSGDFKGPMTDGCYWYVNHCEYSRWASVDRIRATSFECVKPILEHLFITFGVPLKYKTDNGPPFQSHLFACFAKHWGFKHRKITPLWPRANAEVESFMQKLNKVDRRAAASGKSRNQELQAFLVAYRATPHSTTKVPPAVLMLNRPYRVGIPENRQMFDMKAVKALAEDNDAKAKNRMKQEYDQRMKVRECRLTVGDLVLVQQPQTLKSSTKWDPCPYVVETVVGSMITAARADHTITRNSSHFKLYLAECDHLEIAENAADPEGPSEAQGESGSLADAISKSSSSEARAAEAESSSRNRRGRHTKAQAADLERQRRETYERYLMDNPPERRSVRLAQIKPGGGKM